MSDELADIQNAENNAGIEPGGQAGEQIERSVSPEKSAKPEKLSIRQALEKSVETVREAEAKADKAGRLHKSDGKFAPKTVEAEAAPVNNSKPEKDAQPSAASKPNADGPPPGLSKESKALWETLPPAIKADAVRREQEFAKGIGEYKEKLSRYQEIEQVLAPMRQVFQQAGVPSDAEAVKRLLGWEGSLRNPATRMQAFYGLARQYGINLNSPQSQAQEIPDQLRPVYDHFGQLTQQVSSMQGELQRSREEQVSKTLTDFAKDKPHFEKVRMKMGQLIQAGIVPPTDLEGAYQQAIYADPDIRSQLFKEQTEKQLAELQKNQTNRAQAARAAAISPSTRSPSRQLENGAVKGKQSVRDALNASIKELSENRA